VVIVPCGITASLKDEEKDQLLSKCKQYEEKLNAVGVRVKGDYRDNYSPGWKFNHWELKGVPLRIEIGPRDVKQGEYVLVRRDTAEKKTLKENTAQSDIKQILEQIHEDMYKRALDDRNSHLVHSNDWSNFCSNLDKNNIIVAPFCGEIACEDNIKKDSAREDIAADQNAPAMGAKSLCIPFEYQTEAKNAELSKLKCIYLGCQRKPKHFVLFGRSY